MNTRKTLFWGYGIAGTALLAAIAIYCLARIYPPQLLIPFQTTDPLLAQQTTLFGSAPSLFYTFAIGLFVGSCASSRASAKLHCLNWMGLSLLLEISQHPVFAKPLAAWIADTVFLSGREIFGPYWNRGVFDPLDLIATIAGGLAALILINYFAAGDCDDNH